MKNFIKYTSAFILLLLTGTNTLFAHPGHGATDGHSMFHYLTEPMHVMVLAVVIIMIASSATWFILRKRNKETVSV